MTESATLQERLRDAADGARDRANAALSDPVTFLRSLELRGRFHRDTGFGRVYHPGGLSLRENRRTDSLHVVVTGDHVAAHVDRVSPLEAHPEHPSRYSFTRAAAHNVVGAAHDFVRLLRGRQGDNRSHLDCKWVWDRAAAEPTPADLLDPATGAWSVHVEARVEGVLDEDRMRKALAAVLDRRPLDHDPLRAVDCPDDAALDAARTELLAEPAGARHWPPVRAVLAHHPGGDVILLNVNHAASDGFGARHLLACVAEAYATGAPSGPPLDFLAVSDLPVVPASAPVSYVARWFRTGVERLRDALANPARIAPDGPSAGVGHGVHLVSLSVDDTRRVASIHRPGTARNVLLAALHLAVGDWNLDHGTPGRRVGVLIPVDLRRDEWDQELIGNFSVTARVSTSRRHRAGPRTALIEVRSQKDRNKRTRTGIALLAALERNGLLPLWALQSLVVLQPLTRNREVDTALLANIGWIEDAPSFGPDAGETVDVWFSSPARTPRCLCIGVVTVSGRLHLTLRYPHQLFSADAARRFADVFVGRLLSVAESRW